MEREHLAKACSAMLYGYLHGQLQFTDEQAQKVRGWLDEKFVAKASAVKRRDLSQPTIRPLGQDFSEFEKLLTPVQKERWKDTRFALEQRLPL